MIPLVYSVSIKLNFCATKSADSTAVMNVSHEAWESSEIPQKPMNWFYIRSVYLSKGVVRNEF